MEARVVRVETLIIGAGRGGLGAAIRLQQAGRHDFVILERAGGVGGAGAPSDAQGLARDHGLLPKVRLGQSVNELRFHASEGEWEVRTDGGEVYRARSVIAASGALADPRYPSIEGIDGFAGRRIHSARWDREHDFTGQRVAVIGTGASAVRIVPELVRRAEFVKVFQRTPRWVLPRIDRVASTGAARAALSWAAESAGLGAVGSSLLTGLIERVAEAHLRRQVKDLWLRRQLTPNRRDGGKRFVLSDAFYPALQEPNCKLITWPIVKFTERGVVTAEGVEHRVDGVVFATGFDVRKSTTLGFPVIGLDGRALGDTSASLAGYPNLHFIVGPNPGPGDDPALRSVASQIDSAVRAVAAP